MEYLSRILIEVSTREGYKYHHRCGILKINHLCFADDLLLFCSGDFISVLLTLQGLKLFSATSGLLPNTEKSAIYFSNVAEMEIKQILDMSGYRREMLPFRYLGMPICSKKISKAECSMILEKMVARIRVWSTRNISYMGRVILINAVLM